MANQTLQNPKVTIQIDATVQNQLSDGVKIAGPAIKASTVDKLTSGVNENQANRGFQLVTNTSVTRTIAAGDFIIVDLYDLGGDDPFDLGAGFGRDGTGQALTIEEVVAIKIKNENAVGAAGQLEVKPASTQGWTPIGSHTVANGGALRGQGVLCKYQPAEAGFDVADGTSHRLRLEAVGGAVNYSLWVLGRHDDEESSSESSSSSSESSSSQSSSESSGSSSSSSISTSSVSSSSSPSSSSPSSSSSSISTSSSSSSSSSSISTSSSSSESSSSESSSSQS